VLAPTVPLVSVFISVARAASSPSELARSRVCEIALSMVAESLPT